VGDEPGKLLDPFYAGPVAGADLQALENQSAFFVINFASDGLPSDFEPAPSDLLTRDGSGVAIAPYAISALTTSRVAFPITTVEYEVFVVMFARLVHSHTIQTRTHTTAFQEGAC